MHQKSLEGLSSEQSRPPCAVDELTSTFASSVSQQRPSSRRNSSEVGTFADHLAWETTRSANTCPQGLCRTEVLM